MMFITFLACFVSSVHASSASGSKPEANVTPPLGLTRKPSDRSIENMAQWQINAVELSKDVKPTDDVIKQCKDSLIEMHKNSLKEMRKSGWKRNNNGYTYQPFRVVNVNNDTKQVEVTYPPRRLNREWISMNKCFHDNTSMGIDATDCTKEERNLLILKNVGYDADELTKAYPEVQRLLRTEMYDRIHRANIWDELMEKIHEKVQVRRVGADEASWEDYSVSKIENKPVKTDIREAISNLPEDDTCKIYQVLCGTENLEFRLVPKLDEKVQVRRVGAESDEASWEDYSVSQIKQKPDETDVREEILKLPTENKIYVYKEQNLEFRLVPNNAIRDEYVKLKDDCDRDEINTLPQNFTDLWNAVVQTREGKRQYTDASTHVENLDWFVDPDTSPLKTIKERLQKSGTKKALNPNGKDDLLELYEDCDKLLQTVMEPDPMDATKEIPKKDKEGHTIVKGIWKKECDNLKLTMHSRGLNNFKLCVAPLKGKVRALYKYVYKYERDATHLTDVVRCSFVFNNVVDLGKAAVIIDQYFKAFGGIKNMKDRISRPACGYRDVLINVVFMGVMVEIQLHLEQFYAIKTGGGHSAYRVARHFRASNFGDICFPPKLPSSEKQAKLRASQMELQNVEDAIKDQMLQQPKKETRWWRETRKSKEAREAWTVHQKVLADKMQELRKKIQETEEEMKIEMKIEKMTKKTLRRRLAERLRAAEERGTSSEICPNHSGFSNCDRC